MANAAVTRSHDVERTCDKCGKTFKSDGAWYAKHALSCDGTKPATRGRIDRLTHRPADDRTPPATRHPRTKAARRAVRPRKAKPTGRELAIVEPTALVIPVGASARLTFLDQARAARDRLDVAIAAIEAIG